MGRGKRNMASLVSVCFSSPAAIKQLAACKHRVGGLYMFQALEDVLAAHLAVSRELGAIYVM